MTEDLKTYTETAGVTFTELSTSPLEYVMKQILNALPDTGEPMLVSAVMKKHGGSAVAAGLKVVPMEEPNMTDKTQSKLTAEKCSHCRGYGYTKGSMRSPWDELECKYCKGTGNKPIPQTQSSEEEMRASSQAEHKSWKFVAKELSAQHTELERKNVALVAELSSQAEQIRKLEARIEDADGQEPLAYWYACNDPTGSVLRTKLHLPFDTSGYEPVFTRPPITPQRELELLAVIEQMREVMKRASTSLGAFCSDEGWSQADMDVMDSVDATLTLTPSLSALKEHEARVLEDVIAEFEKVEGSHKGLEFMQIIRRMAVLLRTK